MDPEQRFWPTRVRWRLRGAWMWPTFVVLTLVDGLVLHRLPPVSTGVDLVPAILIAVFGNLVLVGALAPWLARRMWARRPAAEPGAPPMAQVEVLIDRVGTGLLVAGVAGVVAAGLAARPLVVAETDARERAAKAILRVIENSGNEELIRNTETAQTARLDDGTFRTCIAQDDRRHFWCYIIDPSKDPVKVDRDPSGIPNGPVD
ncbi:MAG TPA: hypothetical protein VFQ12_02880 [Thermoleophilaceae bacterium]|nr:hypothetical protein [Thermoleophilaceae bacterium]